MCVWSGVVGSVVFIFKQKTAYDMRISDWSSDVCASDLSRDQRLSGVEPVPMGVQISRAPDVNRILDREQDRVGDFLRNVLVGPAGVERDGDRRDAEIGRASCRERVCQYV